MSVNFSTITPMSQSTISRMPAYTNSAQPAASSPITTEQPKKKSRWFLKTLIVAAAALAATAALRGKVDAFKTFDKTATLAEGAKFLEKVQHYGKKAVAVVGDFVIDKSSQLVTMVKGYFNKGGSTAA